LRGAFGSVPMWRVYGETGARREAMLTTIAIRLALVRFGVWRAGGSLLTLFGLAVVGVLVWALTRPDSDESTKR